MQYNKDFFEVSIHEILSKKPCVGGLRPHLEVLKEQGYDNLPVVGYARCTSMVEDVIINLPEYFLKYAGEPTDFDCSEESGNKDYKDLYRNLYHDIGWLKHPSWIRWKEINKKKSEWCSVLFARYLRWYLKKYRTFQKSQK